MKLSRRTKRALRSFTFTSWTPATGEPTYMMDLYREVVSDIKRRCDVVIGVTSGGFSPETGERTAAIRALRPELGSFNAGSMNFGLFHVAPRYKEWKFAWEPEFLQGTEDLVFANSFRRLREFCAAFEEAGTKPEIEVYDLGMINNVAIWFRTATSLYPSTCSSCSVSWGALRRRSIRFPIWFGRLSRPSAGLSGLSAAPVVQNYPSAHWPSFSGATCV